MVIAVASAASPADIFHMKAGNAIEGEVLDDRGDAYRVRVAMGVIDIKKADIERRVRRPTPWERYRTERRKYPETADGHYDLAQWCAKHALRDKERKHLGRAVELDPDHEPAHRALGHERVDGKWVEPGGASRRPGRVREPPANSADDAEADKLVRQIISNWTLKIRAIYRSRLACSRCGPDTNRFREGRQSILAIRDPLAVPALTSVLVEGGPAVRRLLVESLSQFTEDEATMNLIVLSLTDGSATIRRLAAVELVKRDDPRVVEQFHEALRSGGETVLRRAAAALGTLKDRGVVEDLVDLLSTRKRARVRETRPVFYRRVITAFGGVRTVSIGGRSARYRPKSIGVLGDEVFMGTEDRTTVRTVDVHRTEVQEALIAITGRNFGFDRDAWLRWWRTEGARAAGGDNPGS